MMMKRIKMAAGKEFLVLPMRFHYLPPTNHHGSHPFCLIAASRMRHVVGLAVEKRSVWVIGNFL